VNAGAVHAYVRGPDGGTNYLAELTSGEEVQVVDLEGNTRETIVGRAKIERRPMFRVEAEIEVENDFEAAESSVDGDADEGENASTAPDRIETLLQNAETIKVATREGRKAVTDLEAGDEVLVYYEAGGRHFGEAIEESIIEQ
jgi:3-dehydroquinate synthase II